MVDWFARNLSKMTATFKELNCLKIGGYMRFIVPYFAGMFSSLFVMTGILGSPVECFAGVLLAILTSSFAALYCYNRHKKKQKEYYNRFSIRSKGIK